MAAKLPEWQAALKKFNKNKSNDPLFITTLLTPEDADCLLEDNDHNRRVTERLVARYLRFMQEGLWGLNGETIKVCPDGVLIDGQHRLRAIQQFGQPVKMSMALGIEFSLFDVTDTGKSRGPADILKIAGYKNASSNAAAMNTLIRYKYSESFTRPNDVSPQDILYNMELYPHITYFVKPSSRYYTIISNSVVQFFMYVFMTIDEEKSYDFFSKLLTGVNLKSTSSVLMLRNLHMSMKVKKLKMDRRHVYASIILAWNAFYEGTKIETVKWNAVDFPIISGIDRKKLFKKYSGFGKNTTYD